MQYQKKKKLQVGNVTRNKTDTESSNKRCWQTWVFATKRVLEFPFDDTNSKAKSFNVLSSNA